ncbi:MAG: iron-containing alcohol dehydrogenase [Eubacteriales bacterium]|nr:iron-containing alcohol dehydrogenase [Eubacteriales bacterium]
MYNFLMRTYQKIMYLSSFILPWREPELIEGQDAEDKVLQLLEAKGWKSVLFITGPNIYRRGLPISLIDKLKAGGIHLSIFNETLPNPPIVQVEECVKLFKEANCDLIIGFGGGSPMDLAKATAARIARPRKSIPKLKGVLKVLRKTPPIIAVPTTAGSGSEVTLAAVITDLEHQEKYAINDPQLIPDYALLKAEYCASMPAHVTASTGMDALTHALEAYIGKSNTKYTRAKAESAVALIFNYLIPAYKDGNNLEARAKMQLAAFDAGCAFTRAYVGYVHALSHALSAFYGTAHGLANAIILPYVLKAYGQSAEADLAKLARQNNLVIDSASDQEASAALINEIIRMNAEMNIPEHLPEIKVTDIPALVHHAIKEANPLYPVPKIMREAELSKLYLEIKGPSEDDSSTAQPASQEEAAENAKSEQEKLISKAFARCQTFYQSQITKNLRFRKLELRKLKKTIEESEAEIYAALKQDLNKAELESYMTEISIVKEEINYMLRHLKRLAKAKKRIPAISQAPASLKITYEPYGVALIMSPWNYPFLLTLGPLVNAIAAGNCAVIKPSAYSPATSALIKRLCQKAFTPGLVEVIEGGREENQALLRTDFDYIFFTGSPAVGKFVMSEAAKRLIPVTLELGGKSPCIVDQSADLKKTAKRILFGKLTNAGQTCVAPDYLLVEEKVKDELILELLKGLEKAFPSADYVKSNYVKMIQPKHFQRMRELLAGQKLIYPQNARNLFPASEQYGQLYLNPETQQIMPVLVDEVSLDSRLMQEEIFGPILPIISWTDQAELLRSFKDKEKPLALYLFTKDSDFIKKALNSISSGGVAINDTLLHMASSKAPFGGVGNSGMGNYHGDHGFYTFSHERTVLKKSWYFDVPMRHHPYSKRALKILKKLLA